MNDPQAVVEPKTKLVDRFWFRILNEILYDFRFVGMTAEQLAGYVRLVAMGNTNASLGVIRAPIQTIARILVMDEDATSELLVFLEEQGLVYLHEGAVFIADERHYEGKGLTPSASRAATAERQRRRRAGLKAELEAMDVTDSHSDTSRDIEENSDSREQSQSENRTSENSQIDRADREKVLDQRDLGTSISTFGGLALDIGSDDVELL